MRTCFLLVAIFLLTAPAFAQIPNGDFENWDASAGYLMPVGWDNNNAFTNGTGYYTCERNAPGYTGAYYLSVTTRSITGKGTVPGVAICGHYDPVTHDPIGIPYTSRPQVIRGQWQYMAFGADQGYILVRLTKWNSTTNARDTIANTFYALPGMEMAWDPFQIPINYLSSDAPDTALIQLSASGATFAPIYPNGYLWVDDLVLGDSVTLGVDAHTQTAAAFSVYPDPASGPVTIAFSSPCDENMQISVADICGRTVRTINIAAQKGNNSLPVSINGLPKGMYLITLASADGRATQRLVIQ